VEERAPQLLVIEDARDQAVLVGVAARHALPGLEVHIAADGQEGIDFLSGAAAAAGTADPVTPDLVVSPPDGFMGIIDFQTYILTKQNWGTPNQPQAHPTWVDLHGLGTGNPPNYHLNVSDLAQIMFAHLGLPWVSGSGNLDPGQCP